MNATAKECTRCKITKPFEVFVRDRRRAAGLHSWCKACKKVHMKAWMEANKGKNKAYQKAWEEANKDWRKAYQKAWNEANKDANKEKRNSRERARRKVDPVYKFLRNYRSRLATFFSGSKKTAPTAIALGCSADHVCRHLESQFAEGMTWGNYGTAWEVDHIFPLAKANVEDPVEFFAVCNWRNLQPLTPKENREKGDKITPAARRLFNKLCEEFADAEPA